MDERLRRNKDAKPDLVETALSISEASLGLLRAIISLGGSSKRLKTENPEEEEEEEEVVVVVLMGAVEAVEVD
jgi:hypothetical protein